jgi:hypothetical protein
MCEVYVLKYKNQKYHIQILKVQIAISVESLILLSFVNKMQMYFGATVLMNKKTFLKLFLYIS